MADRPSDVHVALIRAVMIGREGLHREVLLDIVERAGGRDAVSYISTGNVSFRAPGRSVRAITARIEGGIGEVVGRPTPVYVRSLDELREMVASDPWTDAPIDDPVERIVVFFREAVPDAIEIPCWSDRDDIAIFAAGPREVFCVNRSVGGRVRGPGGWIERIGGEPMTSRAWSTIERVVTKLTT